MINAFQQRNGASATPAAIRIKTLDRILGNVYIRHIHLYQPNSTGLKIMTLFTCTGFEWDEGNAEKNWVKHRVSRSEIEQAFFNRPVIVADDVMHSQDEPRFYLLGQTDRSRKLFMVFTIRGNLIRVISARDMSRAERKIYDEKEDTEIRE